MPVIVSGEEPEDRVEIGAQGYEREPSGAIDDDNWLSAEVRVLAGTFHRKIGAAFVTFELKGSGE